MWRRRAKIIGDFCSVFWAELGFRVFVLVGAVCGPGLMPYASLRAHEVLQKIRWEKFGCDQVLANDR